MGTGSATPRIAGLPLEAHAHCGPRSPAFTPVPHFLRWLLSHIALRPCVGPSRSPRCTTGVASLSRQDTRRCTRDPKAGAVSGAEERRGPAERRLSLVARRQDGQRPSQLRRGPSIQVWSVWSAMFHVKLSVGQVRCRSWRLKWVRALGAKDAPAIVVLRLGGHDLQKSIPNKANPSGSLEDPASCAAAQVQTRRRWWRRVDAGSGTAPQLGGRGM